MPVTQANLDCEHVTQSSVANETLSYLFDNLINIIPSVTIDIGAEYNGHIKGYCDPLAGSWTKTMKTWSLPTNCLVYDNRSNAFIVPTVPSGLAASAAASSGAMGLESVSSNSANHSLSSGSIAGICVGVIAGVTLLAAGGFFLWQRTRQSLSSSKESPTGYEATRVEEQYEDGNENKADDDLEVRSFVPSPLSSTYDVR